MAVNGARRLEWLIPTALALLLAGCGGASEAPVVTWAVASSQLGAGGESGRLDVVVDLRNGDSAVLTSVRLVLSFLDGTEAEFVWDTVPAYAVVSARQAVELKVPVKDGSMLGGAAESMIDPRSVTTLYALEVKGAELSFTQGGVSRTQEVGRELSQILRQSFATINKGEAERSKERALRLQRVRTSADIGQGSADEGEDGAGAGDGE